MKEVKVVKVVKEAKVVKEVKEANAQQANLPPVGRLVTRNGSTYGEGGEGGHHQAAVKEGQELLSAWSPVSPRSTAVAYRH